MMVDATLFEDHGMKIKETGRVNANNYNYTSKILFFNAKKFEDK